MIHRPTCPAISAGLMGGLTIVATPHVVFAAPVQTTLSATEFFVPFGSGIAVGVLLGVGATMLATRQPKSVSQVKDESGLPQEDQITSHISPEEQPVSRPRHAVANWDELLSATSTHTKTIGAHATDDYVQIAENQARVAHAQKQRAVRKRGVHNVLAERLGSRFGLDMMDGLPVIPRADGTVADIGTSWWHKAVDSSAMIDGFSDIPMPSTDETVTQANDILNTANLHEHEDDLSVPTPSEILFSQQNLETTTDTDDMWEQAMDALDRSTYTDEPFEFIDAVGDADSLDDPDNLEPQTQFIPFRAPAGHPEVVDTESYISYILDDEFSKIDSKAVKSKAYEYLKVIDGGTTKHIPGRRPHTPRSYRPRHFKSQVKEALFCLSSLCLKSSVLEGLIKELSKLYKANYISKIRSFQ